MTILRSLIPAIALCLTLDLSADESYSVQKIPVPANVVLEVSGLDYARDGTLYICTRHGDVWTVKDGNWKHFAWGLHESMGLCLGDKPGQVFVSQRPEITELVDTDGDGVADQYNTFCDGFSSVHSFHQYTYGLVRDKEGNLCGVLSTTGKTKPDGSVSEKKVDAVDGSTVKKTKTPDGKQKITAKSATGEKITSSVFTQFFSTW